VWYRF